MSEMKDDWMHHIAATGGVYNREVDYDVTIVVNGIQYTPEERHRKQMLEALARIENVLRAINSSIAKIRRD